MQDGVNKELIRTLALANGLTIPDRRLEIVWRQYETYLRLLERLDSFPVSREAEPATVFSLALEPGVPGPTRETRR